MEHLPAPPASYALEDACSARPPGANDARAALPLRPAGHNFCKPCLEKKYGGMADEIDAGAATGRSLRVRKVQKPCPTCKVSCSGSWGQEGCLVGGVLSTSDLWLSTPALLAACRAAIPGCVRAHAWLTHPSCPALLRPSSHPPCTAQFFPNTNTHPTLHPAPTGRHLRVPEDRAGQPRDGGGRPQAAGGWGLKEGGWGWAGGQAD